MNLVEVAILMPVTMGNQLWQKNHILRLKWIFIVSLVSNEL